MQIIAGIFIFENDGELYLLWGHNTDTDFSHYKLYRSEKSGFIANKDTFVADVLPEKYVVGRYADKECGTRVGW